jgi:predicted nucleic acid-binding protein
MERQSCLRDRTVPVIADTSVVINLNATQCAETILDALPNPFLVVTEVVSELQNGLQAGRNDAAALGGWLASRRVRIVPLGGTGTRHFFDLVSGPAAQTLDDGEAATIALALETAPPTVPLIDERKANRICTHRFADLVTGSTVDLLAQDDVHAALGRDRLASAVFNALYFGRMRVLPHHLDWVVSLIGPDRAKQCESLPRSVRSG